MLIRYIDIEKVDNMYFPYGNVEVMYLKERDRRMGDIIDRIGHIEREVDDTLFSSVVHHIVGQQISTRAQATVWGRMKDSLFCVTPLSVAECDRNRLQSFGLTWRKADYILDFSRKVLSGEFSTEEVAKMTDEEAVSALTSLKGIGVWTAEMILLFGLRRPDIFSCDDLAIQRGLRMVYHHRSIDRELFERYRRRFSPYSSVASLYLWSVAGGAVPGLSDPAHRQEGRRK
jgi:DNA-3-methyladenine glycosylase II